jgi:hypothetical protein
VMHVNTARATHLLTPNGGAPAKTMRILPSDD